jgi:hypothetical protein
VFCQSFFARKEFPTLVANPFALLAVLCYLMAQPVVFSGEYFGAVGEGAGKVLFHLRLVRDHVHLSNIFVREFSLAITVQTGEFVTLRAGAVIGVVGRR